MVHLPSYYRCLFHGMEDNHRSLQHGRFLWFGGSISGSPALKKPLVRNGMRKRRKLALRMERNHSPRRDGAVGDSSRGREWGRLGERRGSRSAAAQHGFHSLLQASETFVSPESWQVQILNCGPLGWWVWGKDLSTEAMRRLSVKCGFSFCEKVPRVSINIDILVAISLI